MTMFKHLWKDLVWIFSTVSPYERFADTGAEVFKITLTDEQVGLALQEDTAVLDNLNITKITSQSGINGNPRNRYIWSMALDDNEDLYVGTLNQNYQGENRTGLIQSILKAPCFKKLDALTDTLLRQWSGLPVFETDGGQIYKYISETNAAKSEDLDSTFEMKLQAPQQHLGFRKMVNYNGMICAGSANGPEGPYDADSYDFSFYEEGTGAKIFCNTGENGTFTILDDEGHLDSGDKTIRGMAVSSYSNRLFIGTEAYPCAKLVVYNADGTSEYTRWKSVDVEEEECALSISQVYDLGDGKIVFGAWKKFGYSVYMVDETNKDELFEINTPDYLQHFSQGVMELKVFKGHFYVGILSFLRGFALVRTPFNTAADLLNLKRRRDWELISGNGFQKEQQAQLGESVSGNDYTWSSVIANGIYFIGTFAGSAREERATGQLWASYDGLNWKVIQSDVFDASRYMYGFRTMEVTEDQKTIYIGSAVNMYIPDS